MFIHPFRPFLLYGAVPAAHQETSEIGEGRPRRTLWITCQAHSLRRLARNELHLKLQNRDGAIYE